ncbi:hypothetical protein [Anaeromyxobacter oryzae]|uniref:Uncharacterized protein n=1 Tax=Anaeromyxobacter oryzae TaxID=2918170 RepID=A0ABN6MW12_9BACT|nr:hypothetical protein [Anaeromyxobacter oryzae]BDG04726.1 hypothetical protein AMOR_37220 [Anaeromyxobacter oryzae]
MSLENGMLVQHASLGLGKIVALEPKAVHVFFAASDARFATKLRLPMALSLLTPAAAPDAWLSGLSGFALDEKTGRYGRAGSWLSHGEAVARFLEAFPEGFADPRYVATTGKERSDQRASRWRRAHEAFVEELGNGQGERLLEAGDVAGLVERAVRVERNVRTLHKDADKISLEVALKDPGAARTFFAALFELLASSPDQTRFEALAEATAALTPDATPESRWPTVTLLPFVARPELHMLLRPRFACDVAQRLGLELAYSAAPNWKTYSALLGSAALLLEKLRPLGAKDHVDVEAFMHVSTAKQPKPRPELHAVT